jgi:uncharacterized membrane protein
MLSLWTMARGRIVAALVAGLVTVLAALGVAQLTPEEAVLVETLAAGVVNALALLAYGLYHIWRERRQLLAGEIVPSRIERLDPR